MFIYNIILLSVSRLKSKNKINYSYIYIVSIFEITEIKIHYICFIFITVSGQRI